MSEFSSQPEPGDYTVCRQVLKHLWTLIDGEVTAECTAELSRTLMVHIKECPPCEDHFQFEQQVLRLVGAKCRGETAPAEVRERLRLHIRTTEMIIDPDDEGYDPAKRP